LQEQRERGFFSQNNHLNKGLFKGGPSAPMNQRFSDSLFILGCLFSLCFFGEQERKDFFSQNNHLNKGLFKGGAFGPMNQRFADSLFILGCLFFSSFFCKNREKGVSSLKTII